MAPGRWGPWRASLIGSQRLRPAKPRRERASRLNGQLWLLGPTEGPRPSAFDAPVLYSAAVPNNDVTASGAGFSCQAEDVKNLSRAIDELFGLSIKQRAQMGNVGRQWIIENRDYKILAARYIEGVGT